MMTFGNEPGGAGPAFLSKMPVIGKIRPFTSPGPVNGSMKNPIMFVNFRTMFLPCCGPLAYETGSYTGIFATRGLSITFLNLLPWMQLQLVCHQAPGSWST